MGETSNSSSIRHGKLSNNLKINKDAKKFYKNFNMKFKFINKIFIKINNDMYLKFNRFIAVETILQSHKKFKKFKKLKLLVGKKKILNEVYNEALSRNVENTFLSYIKEITILARLLNINLLFNT